MFESMINFIRTYQFGFGFDRVFECILLVGEV